MSNGESLGGISFSFEQPAWENGGTGDINSTELRSGDTTQEGTCTCQPTWDCQRTAECGDTDLDCPKPSQSED